ncbi:MAG: helix-turn-helix domain-containing protein [Clostridia bacterium]|nr:helix-turn-helix domain-containing protein [Clostridia bacterium]
MNIGQNLKTIRKQYGKTQEEIARACEFKQGHYTNWETNKNLPNIINITKLANYYGCSVDYLLGRESEDGVIIVSNSPKSQIEEMYEQLNEQNQIMVIGYITALLQKQIKG